MLEVGWSVCTEGPNPDPLLIGAAQRGPPTPIATCDTLTLPAVAPGWAAQVISLSPSYAFQQVPTFQKLLTVMHPPCAGGVAQHRVFA